MQRNIQYYLYASLFLCRPLAEPLENPSHAIEVRQTGWFAEHELPAEMDPGHRTRLPEAFRVWHGDQRSFFDQDAHLLASAVPLNI